MNSITLNNVINIIQMLADIGFIWFVLYYAIKIVRSNARTTQIFKGIIMLLLVKGLSSFFGLKTINWLVDIFVNYGVLAVIILFSPEIRNLLEHLGQSNSLTRITTLTGNELNDLVNALVEASMRLSRENIGALITIEQGTSLSDYIKTGTKINATVTTELLCSIFVPLTPLHDGAVIIQGNRIACASAYFPPTNLDLPTKYGARHRAAIGISEITDSTTIVVSEETGTVSIAEKGKLTHVDEQSLRAYLLKVICAEEVEAKEKKRVHNKNNIKFDFLLPEEEVAVEEKNEDLMNVIKNSKKASKINPSFAKRNKKNEVVDDKPIESLEIVVPTSKKVDIVDEALHGISVVDNNDSLVEELLQESEPPVKSTDTIQIDISTIKPSLKVASTKIDKPEVEVGAVDIDEVKPKKRTRKSKGGENHE